jgi:hypothetical protein
MLGAESLLRIPHDVREQSPQGLSLFVKALRVAEALILASEALTSG